MRLRNGSIVCWSKVAQHTHTRVCSSQHKQGLGGRTLEGSRINSIGPSVDRTLSPSSGILEILALGP